jgi:hypothetical protein
MTKKNEKILAWHFLTDERRMSRGPRTLVEAGKTYRATGPLELCKNGMHASRRAIDALSYASGSVVCRVEMGGEVIHDTDKLVARSRKVLWMADATTTLHEFSAWTAEWILDKLEAKGYKIDPRSRAAITAKRRWLAGEISDEELAAAKTAARDAARTAAEAAVRAAARDALNAELERRFIALYQEVA